jgi:geranylgeranyl transferase type-2 subunit beta
VMLVLILMIGTFGAHPGHDGHILGTLSTIQILVIQDAVDKADVDRIVACKSKDPPPPCPCRDPTPMTRLTVDPMRPVLTLYPVLLSLIRPDGQVAGDSFGETDSRFTYILLNALSLLGRLSELDSDTLHGGKARELIVGNLKGCMNFDSGFGTTPGAESHGGQSESLIRFSAIAICLENGGQCNAGEEI